jgi:pimeloyl-ACP methyl ester carboxylesterase
MPKEPMPDVIVLLPGITGSVLKKDGKTVWGYSARSIGKALFSGGRAWVKALALPDDDPDVDDLGDGVVADSLMPDLHLLPGLWKIDGYSRIGDAIKKSFDVTPGKNFFEFPYDWRRDNRVAARKLARDAHTWLKQWRESSGNDDARLVLLGHSMGGLVSRYFLECLEGWKDTRMLVTFVTPYRGSPNALDGLANGLKKGPLDLLRLARQLTAIYQLLPVYRCYDPGDGTLVRVGETSGIPNLDAAKAAAALAFHREIESAVETNRALPAYQSNGYRISPVVGIAQKTFQSGRRDGDGVAMLTSYEGKDSGGDGTVPRVSAIPIELSDRPEQAMFAGTKHGSLQNADAVIQQLTGVLTGLDLDLGAFRDEGLVTLEIDDLHEHGEDVTIRARTAVRGAALTATVWAEGKTEPATRLSLGGSDGDWKSATAANLGEGAYRVVVGGDGVQPAEDSFAVVDMSGE